MSALVASKESPKPAQRTGVERFLLDMVPFFYKRHVTYVDVGAFEGQVLRRVLESGLKVREAHLIEPNARSLDKARQHIQQTFPKKVVDYHNVALDARTGRITMHAHADMTKVIEHAVGRSQRDHALQNSFEVESTTLDLFIEKVTDRHISLLKIDIEGHELKALSGAEKLLREERIDVIYVEAGMSPDGTQHCYYRDIEDFLNPFGYRLFKIYEQQHEWIQDSPLLRRVNLAFMSSRFSQNNPYRLTQELHKTAARLRALESKLRHAEQQIATTAQSGEQMQAALLVVQQELVETKSQLDEAIAEREALRTALATTEQARLALSSDLASTASERDELQYALSQMRNHVEELAREARSVAAENSDLKQSSRAAAQALDAAANEKESMIRKVRHFRSTNKQLEEAIRLSKSQTAANTLELDSQRQHLQQARKQNAELRYVQGELLQSVVQVHRRELRARTEASQARTETSRVRDDFAYRLGTAITQRARPGALARLAAAIAAWSEYPKLRSLAENQRTAPERSDSPIGAFPAGSTIAYIPLTLNRQRIALAADADARAIHVGFLASQDVKATVEIVVSTDDSLRGIATLCGKKIAVGAKRIARKLEIVSGQTVQLLQLAAGRSDVTFEVRRVRGSFGILKLQRCNANSEPALPRLEAYEPSVASLPAAAPPQTTSPQVSAPFSADELELKLWGGFARYAIPELEKIKTDVNAPASERESAAWYLARWFFVEEDYARTLENIEFSRFIAPNPHPRIILCEIRTLIQLGRFSEALAAIELELPRKTKTLDLLLLKSTVLRKIELANDAPPDQVGSAQLDALNEAFLTTGLAPLRKRCAGLPVSLANIVANAEPATSRQDAKLSVIVPAFNAAETIAWVLDSLLRQTWRNLEIIVVDDLSTDNTCEIVEDIAKTDSRVRLIRQSVNSGAYPARNVGVRNSTGELVMIHDSDDWSHPQRIEMQIEALFANPHAVAVKSYWVRVDPNLEILGAWIPRGSVFDLNFSSLICRRSLLDAVGLWDEVSVSGDAEFYARIRTLYGEQAVLTLPKKYVLALSLTRENSLTRSKATHLRSLFYGLRWNYRDAYCYWHGNLQPGEAVARFDGAATNRMFPVPVANQPQRATQRNYAVVIISDFAANGSALDRTLVMLEEAALKRKTIAMFHWRKYDQPCRAALHPKVYELCLRHQIDILSPGDTVSAQEVLFPLPGILQHKLDPLPKITAEEVVVLTGTSPGDAGSYDLYDTLIARSHLRSIFGLSGTWRATWSA